MLPIRNISYLLPMCCSFWEKCKNSPKTDLGCSTPLSYLSFQFWNKPICLNSDHDCSGRSTQVQNGNYWLQEIDNPHDSVNHFNWFCLAYDYSHQIWIWYYFVFRSNEISKTFNAYISKLVLWHLSTSSTTVFNCATNVNRTNKQTN